MAVEDMDDSDVARRHRWLALALLPGLGPVRWQALLDSGIEPLQLLDRPVPEFPDTRLPAPARDALAAWRAGDQRHEFIRRYQRCREALERHDVGMICWEDAAYPPLLREIHAPPPVLFIRGDPALLRLPQLAIVGSRKATREGLRNAHEFARGAVEGGLTVTSGLALGIDAAAHEGALAAGGNTVAVLGTGIDQLYPHQNRALGQRIIERGAVVSELAPGVPARPGHFPRRNRIISGLSRAVLVVEAGLRSGSLITARLALEQGREVFAVPGSIRNPAARGCHHLLRQGAALVESAEDVLAEMPPEWPLPDVAKDTPAAVPAPSHREANPAPLPQDLPPEQYQVLQVLEHQVCSSDELVDATGLSPEVLMQAVTLLEMEGLVSSVPGGFQRA